MLTPLFNFFGFPQLLFSFKIVSQASLQVIQTKQNKYTHTQVLTSKNGCVALRSKRAASVIVQRPFRVWDASHVQGELTAGSGDCVNPRDAEKRVQNHGGDKGGS